MNKEKYIDILEFNVDTLMPKQVRYYAERERPQFQVKRVIFNRPATIIFWDDGTKTVVKCRPGDVFDEEKGFLFAFMKKHCGNNSSFNDIMNEFVWKPRRKDEKEFFELLREFIANGSFKIE